MLRHLFQFTVLLLAICVSQTSAGVTFNFDTTGSPQPVPSASLTSAASAATTVSNALAAVNPAYTATIDVQFHFSNLPSGVLGGASIIYPTSTPTVDGINYETVSYDKIKTNTDGNGAAADVVIEMQALTSEANWFYGTDPNLIGGTQDDFESTMIHEIVHSIGWSESMNAAGSNGLATNSWGMYDSFLGDGATTFLNTTTLNLDTTNFANNVTEGTGSIPPNGTGLYFHGPQAMAANGGNPVPLYSPTTYAPGSSVSHLDTDFYTSSDFVMEHEAAAGTHSRTIQPLELAILRDIYGVAVPEPSAFLFLSLLGVLGCTRRRSWLST